MSTALAVTEKTKTAMEGIMQAVANPNVDPAKLHSLLDAQERILNRAAKEAYSRDFALMQEELPIIPKRGEVKNKAGQVQSRYRKFEDIQRMAMPIVRKHGFSVSYNFDHSGDDVLVSAIIMHREGHEKVYGPMKLPRDDSGNKNATQGTGSSASFGKRYVIEGALDLDAFDEDDDAQSLSKVKYITPPQKQALIDALGGPGERVRKFCEHNGLGDVSELGADSFNTAMAQIKAANAKREN